MYIAKVKVLYNFEPDSPFQFYISHDMNPPDNAADDIAILRQDKPLAEAAMKAFSQAAEEFECNGEQLKLLEFEPTEIFDQYATYPRPDKDGNQVKSFDLLPVFLYKTICHCYSCRKKYGFDEILTIKANVRTVAGKYRMIDVEFCKMCRKYFISEVQLAQYENTFGTFQIGRNYQHENPDYSQSSDKFAPDTVLSRHGYFVGAANNPGDKRRQEILWMLLHNNIATKAEIKEILSNFIHYRSENQVRAKQLWAEDLCFLLSLNADDIESDTFLYISQRERR